VLVRRPLHIRYSVTLNNQTTVYGLGRGVAHQFDVPKLKNPIIGIEQESGKRASRFQGDEQSQVNMLLDDPIPAKAKHW
jgi:hypothetical protein